MEKIAGLTKKNTRCDMYGLLTALAKPEEEEFAALSYSHHCAYVKRYALLLIENQRPCLIGALHDAGTATHAFIPND